ncbi:ABC transporter ATP-binding protein [Variovorax sp. PBL-E5]|uniref:ABC transporter ATP-binding protein n=1 Tax=Variovorax sp. PBL-E5 TaxID=434014 RepID=UPI001315B274|nr:ABC transporter ATP-binding protein [Variovorax sp. PBL-E5]VTU23102.1 LIV-I protein F [Variovorax sp. PBL-E5]
MLSTERLTVAFSGATVLASLNLHVQAGEVVAIIGSNGAGKTTTLNAISRIVPASGDILFGGRSILGSTPRQVVEAGIVHVPEGRRIFPNLTVRENLLMGAVTRPRTEHAASIARMEELFPALARYADRMAGGLSGGEQQMLALGRALMAKPRLLMLDEPSLGLSPVMVQRVAGLIQRLRGSEMSILLVEQNASLALALSDRAYVLERGRIVMNGPSKSLLQDDAVRKVYLGLGEASELAASTVP